MTDNLKDMTDLELIITLAKFDGKAIETLFQNLSDLSRIVGQYHIADITGANQDNWVKYTQPYLDELSDRGFKYDKN